MPKENQAATDGEAKPDGTKQPAETQPADTHGAGEGKPETVTPAPANGEPVKTDPEIAGLESERGALLKQVQDLRLEKRTLSSGGKPAPENRPAPTPAPAPANTVAGDLEDEDDDGDGSVPTPVAVPQPAAAPENISAVVKPLQDRLTAFEKQAETDAIREFSRDPEYALISPERDQNNQNWERVKAYFVQRHSATARTKEAVMKDLRDAYYAAFGPDLQRDAEQRGYAKGAAEAQIAHAADIGGLNTGGPQAQVAELTAAQKEAAAKMGLTEDQYREGMKKRGDIE